LQKHEISAVTSIAIFLNVTTAIGTVSADDINNNIAVAPLTALT